MPQVLAPEKRLEEAQKQVRLALEAVGTDHPEAARLSFLQDEIKKARDEV